MLIKKPYNPPVGLRINRLIRADTARLYYGTTTFQITHGALYLWQLSFGYQWLKSIAMEHRSLISQCRFSGSTSETSPTEVCHYDLRWKGQSLSRFRHAIRELGFDVDEVHCYTELDVEVDTGVEMVWRSATWFRERLDGMFINPSVGRRI